MTVAVVNIGRSHTGNFAGESLAGDAIVIKDGRIAWIGQTSDVASGDHPQTIDVRGMTVIPGLIDSHVHTTFGDYTPRQNTVGFLESYVHGGTTTSISASEVHVPGRPTDVVGIKALAIAAHHSYRNYFPGGMTVHGGSVILEPGLSDADFVELRQAGVWLAKGGFGAFNSPEEYIPMVHSARKAGIVVMCHSGGGSIPGSMDKIAVDVLLEMNPNIAGHINGGPTSLTPEENARIVSESDEIALQLVHAGNLRSAIDIAEQALQQAQFHRIMIATDTPTGTGVIPLGMLRQMAELCSLGPLTPEQAVSAATGNVSAVYGLEEGLLEVGRPANLVALDAPLGSRADSAFDALAIGDLPAVTMVISRGELRVTRSRNTPAGKRAVALD
ncbi:amidohydrolase family protein [Homoserinimonas sp. OAct 916]|uniref:amidohydrolase family protein n=1 Tax=Homoserinimonas sp. OAct 916 TaxID=2211450 RepID=UPI000DBE8B70|nr:amidohydrolase family protein [Homoserinimonas sp. OAct 916]